MFIPITPKFHQLLPAELIAIEAKDTSFFQGIKNDNEIKRIVKSWTGSYFWAGMGDPFWESVLKTKQWEFCNFFTTNKKWRTHIMQVFFCGIELNKPLFRQYCELALKNNDNSPILGEIMNAAATPRKKEFLRELFGLAKEYKNESYMIVIESLFQKLNETKGDKKLYEALNKLNIWGQHEPGILNIISDYIPAIEEPRYCPSKILGIF